MGKSSLLHVIFVPESGMNDYAVDMSEVDPKFTHTQCWEGERVEGGGTVLWLPTSTPTKRAVEATATPARALARAIVPPVQTQQMAGSALAM